ncbi:hypothetical protein [Hymenobacter perfusus]|uniref:Lipoprotein n=1 Tax=Hymenobacter perfusus TaxID=1236770 RepID=A0A428K8J3_9BACT|nr:hypothetical protein [Hymenobacter perfusus]RSK42700.1 hypothetical protein EI293_12935 [Hymenobacter perfusus]
MKSTGFARFALVLGSVALGSCSIVPEAATPSSSTQSANNVAPICPDGDCPPGGGGGTGGGYTPTCVAPTSTIRARIVREARLYAYGRSWEPLNVIVGTQGCDGIYPFSVEFRTQNGVESWVGGRYNVNTGEIDVDYIDL